MNTACAGFRTIALERAAARMSQMLAARSFQEAWLWFQAGQWEKALEELDALVLGYPDVEMVKAIVWAKMGNELEALACLERIQEQTKWLGKFLEKYCGLVIMGSFGIEGHMGQDSIWFHIRSDGYYLFRAWLAHCLGQEEMAKGLLRQVGELADARKAWLAWYGGRPPVLAGLLSAKPRSRRDRPIWQKISFFLRRNLCL